MNASEILLFVLLAILALLPISLIYLIIDRNKSKKRIRELEEQIELLTKNKKIETKAEEVERISTNDIFITVGSLLIGVGIITLFGINWKSIPFFWKHVIAFLPLILAFLLSYLFYSDKRYEKYKVGLSVFAPIVVYASFSLIFSLYNVENYLHIVSFIVSLVIIPLVLFYNRLSGIITYYLITLFAISTCFSYGSSHPFYISEPISSLIKALILYIPTVVYFIYNYIKDNNSILTKVNFVALILLGTAVLFGYDLFGGLSYATYLAIISLLTLVLFNRDNLVWYISIIALTITVLFLPVDVRLNAINLEYPNYVIMYTFIWFILGLIYYVKNRKISLDIYPVFLGLIPFVYLINIPIFSEVVANALIVGYGVLLIKTGIENKELLTRLLGLGVFLFLIIKFALFVEELELVTIILVVCGGLFIIVSNYVNKLAKEKQNE